MSGVKIENDFDSQVTLKGSNTVTTTAKIMPDFSLEKQGRKKKKQ